jgi:hypothetical protein
MNREHADQSTIPGKASRIPEDSILYTRIIPAMLVMMGILMVVLILFAAGVIVGLVKF